MAELILSDAEKQAMSDTLTTDYIARWKKIALSAWSHDQLVDQVDPKDIVALCNAALKGVEPGWRDISTAPIEIPFLAINGDCDDPEIVYRGEDLDIYDWKTSKCAGPFTRWHELPPPSKQEVAVSSEGEEREDGIKPDLDWLCAELKDRTKTSVISGKSFPDNLCHVAANELRRYASERDTAFQRGFEDCREKAVWVCENYRFAYGPHEEPATQCRREFANQIRALSPTDREDGTRPLSDLAASARTTRDKYAKAVKDHFDTAKGEDEIEAFVLELRMYFNGSGPGNRLGRRAADTIKRLREERDIAQGNTDAAIEDYNDMRAQVEALREALQFYAHPNVGCIAPFKTYLSLDDGLTARKALAQTEGE